MPWLVNLRGGTLHYILFDEPGRSIPFDIRKISPDAIPKVETLSIHDNWAVAYTNFLDVPNGVDFPDIRQLWACFPLDGAEHNFSFFLTRELAREFNKNSSYPVGSPEKVWLTRHGADLGTPFTVEYAEAYTDIVHPRLGAVARLVKRAYGVKVTLRGSNIGRPYWGVDSAEVIRKLISSYQEPSCNPHKPLALIAKLKP